MTKKELREHCERQVKECEKWAKYKGIEPSGKIYEEHKLILDLINELQDKSYELWKESYEEEHLRNIRLEEKINALGQQSDDYVSRQAIIDSIDSILEHHGGILDVRLVATQLPPVTPIIPTSNDCIARQPLIDNWNSCADMLMDEGDSAIVMDWIFDAPPVTPTHKVGKWINKTHKSGCGISFVASECTCCGKKTLFNCDEFLYNYCPNCGAKMDKE